MVIISRPPVLRASISHPAKRGLLAPLWSDLAGVADAVADLFVASVASGDCMWNCSSRSLDHCQYDRGESAPWCPRFQRSACLVKPCFLRDTLAGHCFGAGPGAGHFGGCARLSTQEMEELPLCAAVDRLRIPCSCCR